MKSPLFLLLALAALAGCARKNADDNVTMSSQFGTKREAKAGQSLALPSWFPADVPMYPGSRVVRSVVRPQLTEVEAETPAAFPIVLDWQENAMKQQGWSVEKSLVNDKFGGVRATKGARVVQVFAGARDKPLGAGITVILTTPANADPNKP